MKYEEHIVVEGLRKGDSQAYKAMVSRFKTSLYVMIYTFVNHKEDAESLMTHTFEDACLKIKYYQPTNKFSTWLFSIAKNNCIDFIRTKNRRITEVTLTEDCKFISYGVETPEDLFIYNQQMEMVERAVSKLKCKTRLMVEEYYFNGLQFHEIADKYQEPSSTIRVRVLRARERLKELLTK